MEGGACTYLSDVHIFLNNKDRAADKLLLDCAGKHSIKYRLKGGLKKEENKFKI